MAIPRYILTRLTEAVWREVCAMPDIPALYRETGTAGEPGYKPPNIKLGHLDPKSLVPRQMHIVPQIFTFEQAVSDSATTRYGVGFGAFLPVGTVTDIVPGGASLYDELRYVAAWIYRGGSDNNKSGALKDPDAAPGAVGTKLYINNGIDSVVFDRPVWHYGPESKGGDRPVALRIGMVIWFLTTENRAGERV